MSKTLDQVGYSGGRLFYLDYPPKSPTHAMASHAFKIYALLQAIEKGYESILWIDASCWAIRPLDAIFERIEKDGYLIIDNAEWTTGQWCSDDALKAMDLDREEAMRMPHCSSACLGLSTKSETAMEFLRQWRHYAEDGITFSGRSGSKDPRVLGHRHDQTVASVIAIKLGMRPWFEFGRYFDYNYNRDNPKRDETLTFLCEGM